VAPDETRTAEHRHGVMTGRAPSATREVFGGSARVFIAEAISLPTGLITAAFLARRFGPGGYGIFTLTMAIVAWLEWTLAALFARAAVKLVADAEDWRPAGAIVLRMYAASGILGFVALWIAAGPLAALMHEPSLARHIRVLALDVPLFMLTQAHQQVLVGTGAYARRATVAAWRWSARMVLVLVVVGAGWSIDGALAAVVGASVLELLVARRYVQPSFRGGSRADERTMWTYALPLFGAAISLRLFDKLDLFVLKALGASATLAGLYGAAQNLTIIPNLVALSVVTLLLSTLSRAVRAGDGDGARTLAANALRGVLVLFPFAGVAAGASTAVSTMIYGADFAGTGPLLAVLIFAALMTVLISVASAILTAAGRPGWAMLGALPVAPLALAGHLAVIPRFGAAGATMVTLVVAAIGAALALVAVHRAWQVWPSAATAGRALIVTAVTAVVGTWWRTTGVMAIVELAVMSALAAILLVALGELTPPERRLAIELARRPRPPFTSSTRRSF
jgi:O-antigen/teichoic acid export membrane protein